MTQNRVREMVPSNRNKEKRYFEYKYFALKRQTNVVVFIYALKHFQNIYNDRPKSEVDWLDSVSRRIGNIQPYKSGDVAFFTQDRK